MVMLLKRFTMHPMKFKIQIALVFVIAALVAVIVWQRTTISGLEDRLDAAAVELQKRPLANAPPRGV